MYSEYDNFIKLYTSSQFFYRVRNDKTKIFYLRQEDIDPNVFFTQVFTSEEEAKYMSTQRKTVDMAIRIIDELIKFPLPNESFHILHKVPCMYVEYLSINHYAITIATIPCYYYRNDIFS